MLPLRRVLIAATVGFSFLAAFTPGSTARGQAADTPTLSSAQQSLLDAESLRFQSQIKADAAELDREIADEATYSHSSGLLQTKTEYLHGFVVGSMHYRSLVPSQRMARIYGDIGVTNGILAQDMGPDRQSVARYTGVYIKRDGRWQLLAWHTTNVAQPR